MTKIESELQREEQLKKAKTYPGKTEVRGGYFSFAPTVNVDNLVYGLLAASLAIVILLIISAA